MRTLLNKNQYELGEERIVNIFLFLPITLKNKNGEYETRWLEKTSYIEKVWRIYTSGNSNKIKYSWTSTRWAD